ncbi:MAG: AAA family ATPase [Phycisphaeraceae bacterium]
MRAVADRLPGRGWCYLHGEPGCGKSVLARAVVERLRADVDDGDPRMGWTAESASPKACRTAAYVSQTDLARLLTDDTYMSKVRQDEQKTRVVHGMMRQLGAWAYEAETVSATLLHHLVRHQGLLVLDDFIHPHPDFAQLDPFVELIRQRYDRTVAGDEPDMATIVLSNVAANDLLNNPERFLAGHANVVRRLLHGSVVKVVSGRLDPTSWRIARRARR